jgi:hypothetical protein
MNTWRLVVMILALSTTLMLPAAEPAAPPVTPPAASKPVTPPTASKPVTPAADAGEKTGETERFEATEKVRADFEVSFPVDI